jgi:hypothetical protein
LGIWGEEYITDIFDFEYLDGFKGILVRDFRVQYESRYQVESSDDKYGICVPSRFNLLFFKP